MADSMIHGNRADEAAALANWMRPWLKWVTVALWLPLLLATITVTIAAAALVNDSPLAGGGVSSIGLLSAGGELVPFSEESRSAGIRRGDQLVALNGRPFVGSGTSDNNHLSDLPEGSIVRATIRSPDGAVHDYRLTLSRTHSEEMFEGTGLSSRSAGWIVNLIDLSAASILIAAAVLLFRRSGQKPVPLLLSFGLLGLTIAWLARPAFDAFGLLSLRTAILSYSFSLLIITVMMFPNGRFVPPWMKWIALLLVVITPVSRMFAITLRYWPMVPPWFMLAALASLVMRYRRLPAGQERLQIRWALFGFAGGGALMVAIMFSNLVVSAIARSELSLAVQVWSELAQNLLFVLTVVTMASGLLVSQLKYRLYDADAVIARSVSFGALALVLVAVFAGAERVIELLGEQWFGHSLGVLAGGIGAAIAAAMILPLHHRLTHWAEHRFQKELIRLRTGLPLLVGDMRETAPVKRIAAATLDSVSHGVRASRAALVFEGELLDARGIEAGDAEAWLSGWSPPHDQGLDIYRADTTFPLRVPLAADGHGRIGWLLLGPRPDGSFYGKDERETLTHIADPVARALEIAHEREQRDAADRDRWQSQEKLNAELLRVLGSLDDKLERLLPSAKW